MTDIGDYRQLANAARIHNDRDVCAGCSRDLKNCDCHDKTNTASNPSSNR